MKIAEAAERFALDEEKVRMLGREAARAKERAYCELISLSHMGHWSTFRLVSISVTCGFLANRISQLRAVLDLR